MNNVPDMNPKHPGANMPPSPGRRHPVLLVLVCVLAIEAIAMIAVTLLLVFDILTQPASSLVTALALTILVALGAAWITAVTFGVFRRAGWTRAGAVVWQLIQLAIAVGAFQGAYAQPGIGWLILIPTAVALVLLVTPPVTAALVRDAGE